MAAAAGISLGTLKRFEAGENVSIDALIRTAVALGVAEALETLFPPPDRRTIADVVGTPPRQRGRRHES